MKIASAHVYTVDLPVSADVPRIKVGNLDGGTAFLDIIVKLGTDTGVVGYGEVGLFKHLQNQHLAAIKEILPHLIGRDPRETARINEIMDEICPDMSYAKSPIDIACWDIFAKSCDVPLYKLLGGLAQDTFPVFVCVWPSDAKSRKDQIARAKARGHRLVQVKIVGSDPEGAARAIAEARALLEPTDTLLVDANTSLSVANGIKLLQLVDPDLRWHLEQPCASMEACKQMKQESGRLLLLDESMTNLHAVLKAHALGVGDVLIFKIGRLGGITKTKQARDLAVSLDKCVRIDGYASTQIEGAAVAHLAASTPAKNLFCAYDLAFHHDMALADGAPVARDGRMAAPEGVGLGVSVREEGLGEAVFSC